MTYTEAIQKALAGDDRGFTFLYEETHESKMYLALQYMKNEDDAMDVLQDAYVKAFAKLDTLQDPEKFPAWLGMIVANTAKNALAKKNPVLFSDMSADPDEEPFEFSIEDEDLSHQPELAYTREETVQLMHEMMDALSEEQRICVLMFHIDGIPIKEIAETLGCSENTVKSRLNYARKNIKKQGEELQKKGYQLYGIAPFTLLLLLLHKDAYAMSGEAEFLSAGEKLEQEIFKNRSSFMGENAGSSIAGEGASGASAGESAASSVMGDAAAGEGISAGTGAASSEGSAAAGTAAKSAAGAAVKSAFLGTTAGKVTAGVIGAVLIGGSAFGVSQVAQYNQNRSTPTAAVQETDGTGMLLSETVPETVAGVVVETESEFESEWESAFETELVPAETESKTELAVETETETIAETEMESETETELSTGLQTEFLTGSESESETETVTETESEDTAAVQAVSFDKFLDLLEGSLTKEELEYMLAYTAEGYVSNRDSTGYYNYLYGFCWRDNSPLEILEFDGGSCYALSVDEANRLISVITDFRFTEENDIDYDNYGSENVDGDIVWVTPCAFGYAATAEVCAAGVTDNYMAIAFGYHHYSGDPDESLDTFQEDVNETRIAILQKKEDGRFQIEYIGTIDMTYLQYPDLKDFIDTLVISFENADTSVVETEDGTETLIETETEIETETAVSVRQVSDDEYADLLEGDLTKEEFEFVLAYGPSSTSALEYEWDDDFYHHLYIAPFCWQAGSPVENLGKTSYGCYCFQLDELNRLLSVFTEYQITEDNDNDSDSEYHISYDVDGDVIWMFEHTFDSISAATITAAGITDAGDLVVLYTCHEVIFTSSSQEEVESDSWEDRAAVLRKNENGNYYLVSIDLVSNASFDDDLADIIAVMSGWNMDTDEADPAETETQTELQSESQTETEPEQVLVIGADPESESESEAVLNVRQVSNEELTELINGSPSLEELEFVLPYLVYSEWDPDVNAYLLFGDDAILFGPGTIEVAYELACPHIVTWMCGDPDCLLELKGIDDKGLRAYSEEEVNRLFSIFTGFQYSEENDNDVTEASVNVLHTAYDVDGDLIWLYTTSTFNSSAEITAAGMTDDELVILFDYHRTAYESAEKLTISDERDQSMAAVFRKNDEGLYQVFGIAYEDYDYADYPEIKQIAEVVSGWKDETGAAGSDAGQAVADEEYPELLEGKLTKEELEFVLAYGPEELTEAGLTDTEYTYILNQFGQGSQNVAHLLTEMGYDANYRRGYLVDEVNRLFSVFTDYRFSEENDTDSEYGLDVDGDIIWYSPAELSWDYSAAITEAFYTEETMIVYYDFAKTNSPDPDVADIYENKAAVLEKNANDNFQIVLITDAASVNAEELLAESGAEAEPDSEVGASEEVVMIIGEDTGNSSEETVMIIGEDTRSSSDTGMTDEIRALYEQVLQDVTDGKYTFPDAEEAAASDYHYFDYVLEGDQYYYFVSDLDADDVPELVVGLMYKIEPNGARVLIFYDCLIFEVESGVLEQLDGNASVMSAYVAEDSNGFYGQTYYYPGTGEVDFCQVTIESGDVVTGSTIACTYDEVESFTGSKKEVTWTDISDLSGLDDIQ